MKVHNQQYDAEKVLKLRRQGLSMANVGKRLGVSQSTVRDVLRKAKEKEERK